MARKERRVVASGQSSSQSTPKMRARFSDIGSLRVGSLVGSCAQAVELPKQAAKSQGVWNGGRGQTRPFQSPHSSVTRVPAREPTHRGYDIGKRCYSHCHGKEPA